jgi:2-dehydro-3-deoxygluconokinase
VVYDRTHSALADLTPGSLDWDRILEGAAWFHITGITPALSSSGAEISLKAMETAKRKRITISCDYNYRKNLWKYGKNYPQVMRELVALAEVGIADEEECQRALGITSEHAGGLNSIKNGQIDPGYYRQLYEKVLVTFPNQKYQALTHRESHNASQNGWSACLHHGKKFRLSKHDDVTHIIDRVGTGDAFSAGLVHGLVSGVPDVEALEFAVAASCLKHSIPGDMNLCSMDEVNQLIGGSSSGRIQR